MYVRGNIFMFHTKHCRFRVVRGIGSSGFSIMRDLRGSVISFSRACQTSPCVLRSGSTPFLSYYEGGVSEIYQARTRMNVMVRLRNSKPGERIS